MVSEERHPCLFLVRGQVRNKVEKALTMLEVHLNIVRSDVRCHGNNGGTVKLPYQVTSRYTVQIRHYNVHQDHIILDPFLNLVHSFQTVKLVELAKV